MSGILKGEDASTPNNKPPAKKMGKGGEEVDYRRIITHLCMEKGRPATGSHLGTHRMRYSREMDGGGVFEWNVSLNVLVLSFPL